MDQRRVISSPFGFSSSQPSPTVPSTIQVPSTSPQPKYGAPPKLSEISQQHVPPTTVSSEPKMERIQSPNLNLAQGGKVSAFAELSNKPPPPLYECTQHVNTNVNSTLPTQPIHSNSNLNANKPRFPCATKILPNQNLEEIQEYFTKNSPLPPPSVREYKCIDQGNCSARYIRASTYSIPGTPTLQSEIGLPIGVMVQPLADPHPRDTPIPLVHPSPQLFRCVRCRAFHNCHDKFVNSGKEYICYLCGQENIVPEEYYSPLDFTGNRMDINQRPELYNGTVEYIAPSDYITESEIYPLSIVFVIETSKSSKETGFIYAVQESIRANLQAFPKNTNINFSFITFNQNIQFFNLSQKNSVPQILVLSDISDTFLPLSSNSLLVNYRKSQESIDKLIDLLPSLCSESDKDICTVSAIRCAAMIMKSTGGKMLLFQTSNPSAQPGALKGRFKSEFIGTSRERELYLPQISYYTDMAKDLSKHHISVDFFIAATKERFIDVGSLMPLANLTGGQIYFYSHFQYQNDRIKLNNEIFRILTRTNCTNAVVRIRASTGLDIGEYQGSFNLEYGSDMHYSCLSSDTILCAKLTITEDLPDESFAGIQCVILYTSSHGEKRIRVHSMRLNVSRNIGKVIASADIETIMYLNTAKYLRDTFHKDLSSIRGQVIDDIIAPLKAYQKISRPGSSFIPDSLALYPLFQLCILKSPWFKEAKLR